MVGVVSTGQCRPKGSHLEKETSNCCRRSWWARFTDIYPFVQPIRSNRVGAFSTTGVAKKL